jgi:methionyl-tRNA synthetase
LQPIKLNHDTESKRYTITAALPYTNGQSHWPFGGVYVPSYIYSRYLRLQGRDVLFVCGSDEHGVYFYESQKKALPQEVIDKYDGIIRKSFIDFGISFDNYSRTSAKIHHDTASRFFKKLYDNGDFIEQVTEQLYDAKLISSWQTVLLWELAQNVATKKRMEINVKMWFSLTLPI